MSSLSRLLHSRMIRLLVVVNSWWPLGVGMLQAQEPPGFITERIANEIVERIPSIRAYRTDADLADWSVKDWVDDELVADDRVLAKRLEREAQLLASQQPPADPQPLREMIGRLLENEQSSPFVVLDLYQARYESDLSRRDWKGARDTIEEAHRFAEKRLGERHWRTIDMRLRLRHATKLTQMNRDQIGVYLGIVAIATDFDVPREELQRGRAIIQFHFDESDPLYWKLTLELERQLGMEAGEEARRQRHSLMQQLLEVARALGSWHPLQAVAARRLAFLHADQPEREESYLVSALDRLPEPAAGEPAAELGFGEWEWELTMLSERLEDRAADYLAERRPDQARRFYELLNRFHHYRHGPKSWQVREAELDLEQTRRQLGLDAQGAGRLAEIARLEERAVNDAAANRIDAFLDTKMSALSLQNRLLGVDPRKVAEVHAEVAEHFVSSNVKRRAAEQYAEAVRALAPQFGDTGQPQFQEVAGTLHQLCQREAKELIRAGNLAEADRFYALQFETFLAAFGENHWIVREARRGRQDVAALRRLDAGQREQLATVEKLASPLQEAQLRMEDPPLPREVMRNAERAWRTHQELVGSDHSQTLKVAEGLAAEYGRQGHVDRATPLYLGLLQSQHRTLGAWHPDSADTLHSLATLYEGVGDDRRAVAIHTRVDQIFQTIGFVTRSQYAYRSRVIPAVGTSTDAEIRRLRELLQSLSSQGEYLAALQVSRETLDRVRRKHGEQHVEYAISLGNEAGLFAQLGDYAHARQRFQEALDLFVTVRKTGSVEYALHLHNLAVLYEKQRQDDQALPLAEQAIQRLRTAGQAATSDFAQAIGTLGEIYLGLGKLAEAEQQLLQAEQILAQLPAASPQLDADQRDRRGRLRTAEGKYDEALNLLERSLRQRRMAFGDDHEDCAESWHNLAVLQELRNQLPKAGEGYRKALEITWANLERASLQQSLRQQIAASGAFRRRLDSYLAFTARIPPTTPPAGADEVYQQILRWKGAAFTRRQQLITLLANDRVTALADQLHQANGQLASHALNLPFPGDDWDVWQQELQTIVAEKEQLERDLSALYEQVRPLAPPLTTVAQIQQALPADGTLIDIIEYRDVSWGPHGTGDRGAKPRLTAFIVPRQGSVHRVDLGPSEPIRQAVADWRKNYGVAIGPADPAGEELKKLLWKPLEDKLLAGAVLIAPDGPLALFPWAALPGKAPGSYLIEERPVATVPVPQVLPRLITPPPPVLAPAPAAAPAPAVPSLLVIGFVDYRGLPGVDTERSVAPRPQMGNPLRTWGELRGTRDEMYSVRGLFEDTFQNGTCQILNGRWATESAVKQAAPQYRWLHFATHGFFATDLRDRYLLGNPPYQNSAPREVYDFSLFHPEVLAGMALAGANELAGGSLDDGLLTALEVSQLRLADVDAAVLSACETGLGDFRAGEGVLSLQRAFHLAGARSVLSTLWKVNDRTTRQMVSDFYTNVWEKKMTKLEALRAAQIAMLDNGVNRGLGPMLPDEPPADARRRLPPYFWACFVLSGDWH